MIRQVNLYEAKSQLSRLVDEAAEGNEIVIAKNAKPVARLVTLNDEQAGRRVFGQWAKLLTPVERAELHANDWWQKWKDSDAQVERDFARTLDTGVAEEQSEWRVTSSTRTRSSGSRRTHSRSKRKRSPN